MVSFAFSIKAKRDFFALTLSIVLVFIMLYFYPFIAP
nr:MAG TPA: hypothetical protein [Caudoviricetes sp.]